MTAIFIALTALTQTPAAAPAPTAEDVKSYLDSLAPKHFRGVFYVEQAGVEKLFHSVGFADPDSKRPFTKETGLCIGSIVKPMVRVALVRLAEAKKLSLDDSISKYFNDVPEDKKPITLQLLSEHRGGFQDVLGDDYELISRDDLMKKMLASKLIFQPGEKDEYSNCGFSMLATILEKVSKKPIEAFIKELEFDPIGVKRIGYVLPKWKTGECAVGTDAKGQRWGSPVDHPWLPDGPSWNLRGNGGMIGSVVELARWARAVNEYEIISKEAHQRLVPGLHGEDTARRFWNSAGGNNVFNTVVAYNPGKRIVIVAASMDGRFEIESERSKLWGMVYRMLP